MKYSAVLMFFACSFLISDGFNLNSNVHRKSNDLLSDKPSSVTKFDKSLVNINPNKVINNNEIANKFKRNEDANKESTKEDSEKVYTVDEDGDGEDDEDEEVYGEDENDKDNDDSAEYEADDNNDYDEYEYDDFNDDEYEYDDFNDGEIGNEGNDGSTSETELLRATRGYVFESSEGRTKPVPRYDDTNYNANNDDNDRDNRILYSYDKVKNQDNDKDDDRNDSEMNIHEEDWPTLEGDNGARAVADYVVDYVQSASNNEEDGNPRCFFGWRLDANGVCAPPRRECEPGFVRNAEGNCVGPDTGYWYK
jgi:hypothetical protein